VPHSHAISWFNEFHSDFLDQKSHLSDLDRLAGDGDFAVNLNAALNRGSENILELGSSPSESAVFNAISRGFLHTGGTSGPLFGMWFRELSKAADDVELSLEALASGVCNGTRKVQKLGGAEAGDKTMVDAMLPAAESLVRDCEMNVGLNTALQHAAEAAVQGAAKD
jgi:dihydroxyacetone kinase-like protein